MIGILVLLTSPIWMLILILILKPKVDREFDEWQRKNHLK